MVDTNASEAGRALVARRWGTQTLDRAVLEVVSRAAELTDGQRADLRAVTEEGGDGR